MRSSFLLLPLALIACSEDPARSVLESGRVFAAMDSEQRAGQLFMSWTLSRQEDEGEAHAQIKEWARKGVIGGVILSLGTVAEAAALVEDLQSVAATPLLIAADFEAGVAYRLEGATHMGSNMLIAATGLQRLARAAGQVTAIEGRALGVHWCFAPVLDVNVNPANPIINLRSFGEDPQAVARFGVAFISGLQAGGMMATGKHFPGHGDVASDSHLSMPTLTGDRERLEAVELLPFRSAVAAGVDSIMTGHLAVPGLGEDPGIPATMSRRILSDLLREDMGFAGLVVTDALNMGGVRDAMPPAAAARKALEAGAQVLLMPPDPIAAGAAIMAADPALLDAAALKILETKAELDLLAGKQGPAADWREVLARPTHAQVAREIALRGTSLLRDREGLLPLTPGPVAALVLGSSPDDLSSDLLIDLLRNAGFELMLQALHPESSDAEIAAAIAAVDRAPLAIASIHVGVREFSGRIGLPSRFAGIADALNRHQRGLAVSFGNPYLLGDFPRISTYLCAFADTPISQAAVAEALLGKNGISGRSPVRIPDLIRLGSGLSFFPGSSLEAASPEIEGMAADLWAVIAARLQKAIDDGITPGAVVAVARRDRLLAEVAVGRETYAADSPPVDRDSLYDLASLTKVCATTPTLLRLVDRGLIDLDQTVNSIFPIYRGGRREEVSIRQLLTHSSGLPAHRPFYKTANSKATILAAVLETELESAPGAAYRYSDLGMMLLMACMEKVTGMSFEDLARQEVFAALAMDSARFASGAALDAVPTEEDAWRGRLIRGEVHDENAFVMGGVSGHAGLFAKAADVARLGVAFLAGGRGWLSPDLARLASQRDGRVPGSSRALGWDSYEPGGSGGSLLSPGAFGHTGFTGTSVWCDPDSDLCIVLLTNRVHPSREGHGIQDLRGDLADIVMRSRESWHD